MIKNYIIISMKRSGQHGIINWLGQQSTNNSIHYNHCNKGWENKEFKPMKPNCVVYFNNKSNEIKNYFFDAKINSKLANELTEELAVANFTDIDFELYNIEDLGLGEYMKNGMTNFKQMKNDGKVIIILRDPFNFTASCLQRKITPPDAGATDVADNIKERLKLWVEHAKQITGDKKTLDVDHYFINYNEWFSSVDYRKKICEDLNLTFTDNGLNMVINYGSGSSFDREKFDGNAQKMDILNRWVKFKDDEEFKELLTPEIIKLSEEIFKFNPLK